MEFSISSADINPFKSSSSAANAEERETAVRIALKAINFFILETFSYYL
jgi:hypothetical protein